MSETVKFRTRSDRAFSIETNTREPLVVAVQFFEDGVPAFLYRCPNTGLRVQGWIANERTELDEDNFEAMTCPACGRVHLVNPKTGTVLGANPNGLAQQTLAIAPAWRFKVISTARNHPADTVFGPHGPSILRHQLLKKVEAYRRNAAQCMRLAARVTAPGDSRLLLALAQRWLHLAEWRTRVEAQGGGAVPEHPLLRARS